VGQQALVASLAGLPAGQLSPVLARLDRRALSGRDLAVVLVAEQRLVCWVQAGMAASQAKLAHCPAQDADRPSVRCVEANEDAADEIALALHLSPASAGFQLARAQFAYEQARPAWQAWRDGLLSDTKMRTLEEITVGCQPETVSRLVEHMLSPDVQDRTGRSNRDHATEDVPTVFRRRAQRVLMRLDPDLVARRRAARLQRRHVRVGHDADGLGYLTGTNLAVEDVLEAEAFVDELARQLKHRGDPRTLGAMRADVFTALLAGRTAEQILRAHGIRWDADEAGNLPDGDEPAASPIRLNPDDDPAPTAADMTSDGTTDPTEAGEAAARPAAGPTGGVWDATDTSGGVLALRPLADLGEPVDPDQCPAETDCSDWGQLIHLRDVLEPSHHDRFHDGPIEWPDIDRLDPPAELDPPPGPPPGARSGPRPGARSSASSGPGSPPRPGGSASSAESILSRLRSRPLVELVVPYDLLTGGQMPGEINRTGLIPADILTRLLAQAATEPSDWCLTTVDDTGRVITHSRTKHDPTTAQKRFVQARDRRYTFPGPPGGDASDTDPPGDGDPPATAA
jgi:hypothetical protein